MYDHLRGHAVVSCRARLRGMRWRPRLRWRIDCHWRRGLSYRRARSSILLARQPAPSMPDGAAVQLLRVSLWLHRSRVGLW